MHIGHFIRDLDGQGGIETYVTRLGSGLAARGHTITYWGLQGTPSAGRIRVPSVAALYTEAQAQGVDLLHLHKSVPDAPSSLLPILRTVHDNGAACPSGTRYLKRTGTPCPRIASLPACLFGHYVDGCGSRRPAEVWKGFRRMADNKAVLPGRPTLTVSQYLKNEMITAGYPASDLHVVLSPSPIGPASPPPLSTETPPHFLFVGRLVPEKGVDWLLDSFARLDLPVHLDIAGTGYHRAALEEQAAQLGLTDHVTFHGWTDGPTLDALFDRARAVVVPSVWHEPAGLVPLEAAAWARPVIAARVGGLPEYAHPSFSNLVPSNDTEALAAALYRLCTSPKAAAQQGRAGYKHVRIHHSMDAFLDRHEALYASLAGHPSPLSV